MDARDEPGMTNWSWCSCLQLAFEFVEEAPISVFGEDLLRARLDQSRFVKAQGIKPDCVLGVVVPPIGVRQFAQGLTLVIILAGEAPMRNVLRNPRRLVGAEVGGLEDGAH